MRRLIVLCLFLSTTIAFAETTLRQAQDERNPEHTPFYKNYVAKYYPKVFAIREHFFPRMNPTQIAQAIDTLVYVLAEKPWFYFFDEEKDFKASHYWEYIVDQCSFINDFLTKARVDLETLEVFLPPQEDFNNYGLNFNSMFPPQASSLKKKQKTKNLLLYLIDTGHTSIYDFYALSFDFIIKLFNEGILLKDRRIAENYYYELDFVVKKLKKSAYEPDYEEAMKTAKELMTILKTSQQQDYDLYDFPDFNKHKKIT